jgi:predicted alpha/beta superfamily hydrolase
MTFNLGFSQKDPATLVIGKYDRIFSKILAENRRIIVHLPAEYSKTNIKYPVLYLLDANWDDLFTTCVGTAGYLEEFGNIPRLMLVGILNTNRDRDMLPTKIKNRPHSGGALNFLNFLTQELIPHINKNYRTESFNILYGGSNAGLFTLYALLERPKSFNAYIASSPMIGHCQEFIYSKAGNFYKEVKAPNFLEKNRFLYMIYGKHDFPKVTDFVPDFVNSLKVKAPAKLLYDLKIIEDDGHVPFTTLYYGLQFLFSDWPLPKKLADSAKLTDLKQYYDGLGKKYGFPVVLPLNTLISRGYRFLRQNKIPDALEILTFGSQQHPYSPDIFYYLGTAYEKKNNKTQALIYFQKALEVDPQYNLAKIKIKTLKE